ncbi:MAG: 16S rRNA (guanine(527)-N(7))-methyltransferase RsmG [Sphingomonadales bacterium]|nr:16S rRNA (guanine(527)-N(7))-methyltransferase RsmG [Sphingomonadales bacterium]
MTFDPDDFARTLDVSRETLDRLKCYAALLEKWQARINLVANSTLPELWRRHFLDSAQLLPLVRATGAEPVETWLDLGSGAGFPGLVLAIMGAGEVHLAESDQRKGAFLRQVIRETGANAVVHTARIEALTPRRPDVITARALAPLDRLLPLAARHMRKESEIWLLKGQHVEEELTQASISWNMQLEEFASQSDPLGRILRIRGLTPCRKKTPSGNPRR